MKCFYHSADLDGHCSGVLIKMAYPDCEMIGINYGDEFPWDSMPIGCGEKVFMVDFSLQPFTDMVKLNIHADPLIWIDHHKSAIEELEEWKHSVNGGILGIQKSGIGACALVWEYLGDKWPVGYNLNQGSIPTFIKLLAEYDVWNHSDPRALPFQYGMRQFENTRPENQHLWRSLFDVEEVQKITEIGGVILDYQSKENQKYASSCSFETELDGLKCIAMNRLLTNSMLFTSVWNPTVYDAMLTFGFRKGQWTVSLYSDREDVDVSTIAKNRGGGGHKGASGFQCKDLPFELK